jgi:thiol-disulfide isomerase/thioredoxin
MKKILALLVAIVSFSCSNAQKKTFSKEALSENLVALDGAEIPFKTILEKHKGRTIVIECWASWCGDCVKAMPKVKELQEKNPDVVYVFLSCDKTSDKWIEGIKKHELKGDHFFIKDGMKGSFGKSIDLDWIPRYIIVNEKGEISLYRAIETDFDLIQKVLNGENADQKSEGDEIKLSNSPIIK